MTHAAFDQHRHGLVHLFADHAAGEGANNLGCLGCLCIAHLLAAFCPMIVRTRAMSRRVFFSWLLLVNCWVATCMRRLNCAFSRSFSSWFSCAMSLARSSLGFISLPH